MTKLARIDTSRLDAAHGCRATLRESARPNVRSLARRREDELEADCFRVPSRLGEGQNVAGGLHHAVVASSAVDRPAADGNVDWAPPAVASQAEPNGGCPDDRGAVARARLMKTRAAAPHVDGRKMSSMGRPLPLDPIASTSGPPVGE